MKKTYVGVFAVAVFALGAYVAAMMRSLGTADQAAAAPVPVPVPTRRSAPISIAPGLPIVDMPKGAAPYKDGTYAATGAYASPGGPDRIGISLVLKDGVITDITATPMPGDPASARYQDKFVSGYKPQVVGKNIADLKLGAVSGSSLTPIGFNDAIEQIRRQAQA